MQLAVNGFLLLLTSLSLIRNQQVMDFLRRLVEWKQMQPRMWN